MLTDPSPDTKSEHAGGGGITGAQVNDIGLVRYLTIRQYEELSRTLRVWGHLQEVLERRQDLGATQVSSDLLDVLRRLLQSCLAIRPWGGPQGGKMGAEAHDIKRVVFRQGPHTEGQGALGLGDRVALHRARAVEQEEHLIATARDAERLRMERRHRTERAIRLAGHVYHRLMRVLGLHEEHEVAVQCYLVTGQRHRGAVGMR